MNGRNGYEVVLTPGQWRDFGVAVRFIHTTALPPGLASLIPHETYPPRWRHTVRSFLKQIEIEDFEDPVAEKLAGFLKTKRNQILELVERAEELASALQARSLVEDCAISISMPIADDRGELYIVDR
jgi:spectinomycin phosphotransferase